MQENKIDAVFFEDVQMRRNVKTFGQLSQLLGVLINLAEKRGCIYHVVQPSKWQSYCRSRGRTAKEIKSNISELDISNKKESKILSIQYVADKFGIETENNNLADAICIGWYACNNI